MCQKLDFPFLYNLVTSVLDITALLYLCQFIPETPVREYTSLVYIYPVFQLSGYWRHISFSIAIVCTVFLFLSTILGFQSYWSVDFKIVFLILFYSAIKWLFNDQSLF